MYTSGNKFFADPFVIVKLKFNDVVVVIAQSVPCVSLERLE
jgi:hypothetical protein